MSPRKTIALIGAHTALAKALSEGIEERDLELSIRRYVPDSAVSEGFDPLSRRAPADLAVICMRSPEMPALLSRLEDEGAPILDLSEAGGPYVWPWLDKTIGLVPPPRAAIAQGMASAVGAIVRSIAPAAPQSLEVVSLESAAVFDQAGVDALSEEVRTLFSMREIEAPLFGSRLAFSILPGLGILGTSHEDADRALAERLSEAALIPARATRLLVPTFSAEATVLRIAVRHDLPEADVAALIADARGVFYSADEAPAAEEAIGRDDVLAGRLSVEPGRIGLFLCADRLRAGSVSPALLFLERWLAGPTGH